MNKSKHMKRVYKRSNTQQTMIKTNTGLSLFISAIRDIPKEDFVKRAIIEKRHMYKDTTPTAVRTLKLIYMMINNIQVDPMEFVKACADYDLQTKKAGYLGLSLCKSANILILTVNTVMKDLKSSLYRDCALSFLCNICIDRKVYTDMSEYLCSFNNRHKSIEKVFIAKQKLIDSSNLRVVGSEMKLLYIKLQIMCDRINKKEGRVFCDNDILFLISVYPTTKCPYMKTKLIQIYKMIYHWKKLTVKNSFYYEIEKDIITISEQVKPCVSIGLSAEIADFFMSMSYASQKAEHFVFRLINSQNPNSRCIGFRLSYKHNYLNDKALQKAIHTGINFAYCRDTLLKNINKHNYKDIYSKKEEMMFVLDNNGVSQKKACLFLYEVLKRMSKYANDDMYIKMYYENPGFCRYKHFSRSISETARSVLFSKLVLKNDHRYFCLLYETMPRNLDQKLYAEIFAKHIHILSFTNKKGAPKILNKLILTFCTLTDLTAYRDILHATYLSVYRKNGSKQVLALLKNGISMMNCKSDTKLINIVQDIFYTYKVTSNECRISLPNTIHLVKIVDTNNKALPIQTCGNDVVITKRSKHNRLFLRLIVIQENTCAVEHIKQVYCYND